MKTRFDRGSYMKPSGPFAAAKFVHDLGSVSSLQVGGVADNFAIGIYNHDMRAARKEDAMRHGISGEIVPATLATQRHLLQQMIARALWRVDCRKSHQRRGANEKHSSPNCSSHRIPPS